jgi:excisionase family DNA binding protein
MNPILNERALASREEAPAPLSVTDCFILSGLPDVLTLEQAASVLQISITGARQMCREKRLRAFKAGTQWRIPRAWLVEFMNGGGSHER